LHTGLSLLFLLSFVWIIKCLEHVSDVIIHSLSPSEYHLFALKRVHEAAVLRGVEGRPRVSLESSVRQGALIFVVAQLLAIVAFYVFVFVWIKISHGSFILYN
jgi:hypothetical protein